MRETAGNSFGHLRLSDGEREVAAAELAEALAEGRLDIDEHGLRLDGLYRAQTRADLVPVLGDLPALPAAPDEAHPISGTERFTEAAPTSMRAFTAMSGADRAGRWVVPREFFARAVMGVVSIDLREARFTSHVTTIRAFSLFGVVEVIAPDDIVLRVDGSGLMGTFSFEGEPPAITDPDAPVVQVKGIALMGSAGGLYRPRAHQRPQKRRWWRRTRGVGKERVSQVPTDP